MTTISAPAESRQTVYRSLAAVARRIPSCRIDGTTHPATLTRWILRGVRLRDGSILKLAAVKSPGGWLTTDEAVEDFLGRLTADRTGEPAPPAAEAIAARQRHLDRVDAELARAGF